MDSKFTKVTGPSSTAKRSKRTGRAGITGKRSTASPRTWRSRNIEILAGRALAERGWQILRHDFKVAGVQIDLLGRDPKGLLHIIEVKCLSALCRINTKQLRRLMNAGDVLAVREPVELIFARVAGSDVELVPVDGLTR